MGVKIGRLLKGGEIVELVGDLGSGKTVLTQGIAQGLGYRGQITSPTFTISRVYPLARGLELHHFDFYRLGAGDMVARELSESITPTNIVVTEWSANLGDALAPDRLRASIKVNQGDSRVVTLESLGGRFDYVIEGLKK